MTATTKSMLLTAFTLVTMAMAIPPPLSRLTREDTVHRRVEATATRDAMGPVCTNGLPASKQYQPVAYQINDYTVVTANANNWTSYAVQQDWYRDHFISGPHVMNFAHDTNPYGPYKCQYTCNAADNCNAYFVWYENVGTDTEHLNCVLFNAVIPPSVFVQTTGTITAGAYDRLCDHSSA
ncbi:uncharacterized protein B0T15DRAFT_550244 [Chaetomium strumarium]|uniref:Apple domain-containing protein n=1 Tax=Chaetomium strumarium TaxID=1170767 RepID=A0AAJ0GY22_9PEZI|nr:hypothetical protein B0T15DRAFT_550244 [Chaetomium strumarium]